MKRSLSLILAALLAASALVACEPAPAETNAPETNAPATDAVETNTPETDAPATTTAMITENGTAKAHIVVAEGADSLLNYAAEELAAHIKLVSGAEVATVTAVTADGMPIVIATPDTNPELEELFADDLAWLRDLGDGEKVRWGSDGFAIRQLDGTLYIFGATPKGALNGVYDFIEDNMGVLWVRADESYGTIYDEMPTISLTAVDYREKSPFELRGWSLSGMSDESWVQLSRNKVNVLQADAGVSAEYYASYHNVGIKPFIGSHNITWWITESPSYDPDYQGYWATPVDGDYLPGEAKTVNIWSDVTAQCVADHVIAYLDENKEALQLEYLGINMEDGAPGRLFEETNIRYEYAPGQFVEPTAQNYISTVWFSFMNKIVAAVNEKHPDIKIHTFAYGSFTTDSYWTTTRAPECKISEHLYIAFAPIDEDLCANLGESPNLEENRTTEALYQWCDLTSKVQVYNYYGCFTGNAFYCRPIWDRIQTDLQLYAANGFNGLVPEGTADTDSPYMVVPNYKITSELRAPYMNTKYNWEMNAMTYWIYAKLAWNPNEDVDALIQYYCDKVYGDASEYMQEYYDLLELGWADGRDTMASEFGIHYYWRSTADVYWNYFLDIEVDGVHIVSAITEALNKAYEAADDKAKVHIRHMKEIYDNAEALFTDPPTPMG